MRTNDRLSRRRGRNKLWPALIAVVALLSLVLAACGSSSGGSSSATSGGESSGGETSTETTGGSGPAIESPVQLYVGKPSVDVSEFCGEKPFKIGLIDGFGGNNWRAQVRAMLEEEAEKCENLEEFVYFDSNLDPEKFISTINSWAAQGVNIIVAYDDFGQLVVPALAKAQQQGVIVVTHNGVPGEASIPEDVSAAVYPDWEAEGKRIAAFMCENVNEGSGEGKIVHFAGPAGNLYDGSLFPAIKSALAEECPGVEYLQDPLVTDWDFGKTQQAAATAINKYPEIDGITTSYTGALPSVERAFSAAGKEMPPVAGNAVSNELVCILNKQKPSERWTILSDDGTGNMGPVAEALGLKAYQFDEPQSGPTEAILAEYINTTKGILPECIPDIPGPADLSNALSPERTREVLGGS